ncbi:sensor histidine kinase [Paenibacillus sp. CN-4]|uniref:sensor histidine kinase n=1 Tax=Paenibacillus nanchangensis TaxID=3348343 RepID=UPI0039797CED
MRLLLKMGARLTVVLLVLLAALVLSYAAVIVAIFLLRQLSPLQELPAETLRIGTLSGLALFYLAVFVWLVGGPAVQLINRMQALSRGQYQETPGGFWSRKGTLSYRMANFLYTELISQLERLAEQLGQNEAERQRLETEREEWLAGISHDLKTPLSYVQGYAAMISAEYEWTPEELRRFGSTIGEKTAHIRQLIDDLNLSFQSDSGELQPVFVPAGITDWLRQIVLDAANSPQAQEHEFAYEPGTTACLLEIDSRLLERALLNLLMNAVLHTPPGTAVQVTLEELSDAVQIQIADNGPGMDPASLDRLFQRYYRGTATDQPAGGSGLGMAIARRLIELHRGQIRAESRPGDGTRIIIRLPKQQK